MRNPFRRDLVLLHPPAIYDFRTRDAFLGPVADAVPSTAIFEMYPVGLTSIAAFLERNHYNVEIINAYRMLRDRTFDVRAALARIEAPIVGIDLHWLPHVQGALAIAQLVKDLHAGTKILIGGLSATYYHEELVGYPFVDFVMRGDSTEEPTRQLLQALREGRPLASVDNLTWKRADGGVVVNPLSFVPETLDYVDVPDYDYVLRSIFKYRSLDNLMPCLEWLRHPITLLLSARGCVHDCAICGGSRSAYRRLCNRARPAFRSPEKLVEDIRKISSFSAAPIFMVHDPRMAGMKSAVSLFSLLAQSRPANELIFELYAPADDRFLDLIERSVAAWSLEMTLESPDEQTRRLNGKFPWSNEEIEATIERALAHRCRTLDVFFMVGLPHQSYADALKIPDYCEHLIQRVGATRRLRTFVAPLGPFLDPGSRAFEQPELGYRRLCQTLADHRAASLQSSWPQMLSYETDAMTRDEIARASYDVAERLNDLKRRYQLIDETTATGVASRLRIARDLLQTGRAGRPGGEAVAMANHGTMFGDDELTWPVRRRFVMGKTLVRSLAAGLGEELRHTAARLVGRYDTAALRG